MSVQALAWAKAQTAGGVAAKAVLLVLADYADEHGACWPSQERIAAECELTDRSVRDQIVKLEAAGLISRADKRRRPDGTQEVDRYQLNMIQRNDVPPDRNDFPADDRRNHLPKPAEPPSETGGTTFRGTTIEPPLELPPSLPIGSSGRAREARRPKSGSSKSSKRVPAAWTPSPSTLRTLESEGYRPGQIERELTMMRDHQFRDAHSDWDAVFRNWVRRSKPQASQGKSAIEKAAERVITKLNGQTDAHR